MADNDHLSQGDGRRLRVLIVEDEFLIAFELEGIVADLGHEVAGHAATGPEAVALADQLQPDLVLMDLHLAHGTCGADAASCIRANHESAAIIFISGSLRELSPTQISTVRPMAMLDKPFRESDLQSTLETAQARLGQRAA